MTYNKESGEKIVQKGTAIASKQKELEEYDQKKEKLISNNEEN